MAAPWLSLVLYGLAAFALISAIKVKNFKNRWTGGEYPAWIARAILLVNGAALTWAATMLLFRV